MTKQLHKIIRGNKEFRYLIILIIAFILYNLFFINKAFNIDDPFTIRIAKAVNQNFISLPKVSISNPVLLGYYFGSIIRLFGESEVWMHIFYLPFSLLAIISMFFLSLRFAGKGLLPTLFLVISPAFLIMSHTIMLDIPELAFFLSALLAFIHGIDKNNNRLLVLSGILAGMAILVKYSGFVLLPVMFVYALIFSRRRAGLFLLIPVVIFFIWAAYNIILYKSFPFIFALLNRLAMLSVNEILTRLLASLSFLTGTSIISLFLIPLLLHNRRNRPLLFSSLPAGLCAFLPVRILLEYSYLEKFLLAFFFICSTFIISVIFKAGLLASPKNTDKDKLFLSSWFIILLVFTIFIQFIAARFILLLLPPMFLLLYGKLIAKRSYSLPVFRKIILFSVTVTFLISTIFGIGDYYFSGIYRDFVKYLKKEFTREGQVYFCHVSYSDYFNWGYSYYIDKYFPEAENERIKDNTDKISCIIFPVPTKRVLPMAWHNMCTLEELDKIKFTKILINQIEYKGNIFLHNRDCRAGFYSNDWGMLPFKLFLKKRTLENFNIYKLILIK